MVRRQSIELIQLHGIEFLHHLPKVPHSPPFEALCQYIWTSPVAQIEKKLPAMQETWVQFLGQEDPLEKGMAPHSSILAWGILWTEEPGGLQFIGLVAKSRTRLSD